MARVEVDMKVVEQEYLHDGLSITAIAHKHGWSVNTLRRRLQAAGIAVFKDRQFGGRKGTGNFPQLLDREWLIEQLKTKPALLIAKELGTTSGNVSDFLKRHGLRSETRSKAVKEGISKRRHIRKWPKLDDHPNWQGGKRIVNGYVKIKIDGHPAADSRGYVLEHRCVMEKHLGRQLKDDEVVHHINFDKTDNRLENLQLLQNQEEHLQLHNTVRTFVRKIRRLQDRIADLENQLHSKEN